MLALGDCMHVRMLAKSYRKSMHEKISKGKLRNPSTMRAIPERFCSEVPSLRGAISSARPLLFYFLKCQKCFYRSDNAIFGKIGRVASDEVVLHLVTTKCIPALLYGLEVCPLTKAQLHSLDFVVTRFLMKLFKTRSIFVIKGCCNISRLSTAERTSWKTVHEIHI